MGMMKKLLKINPLRLSILCGMLSATLSCSSALPFTKFIFFLPFLFLGYFWLTPILLVSFLHGSKYGLIAGGIVVGIETLLAGPGPAALTFSATLFPAIYLTHLNRYNASPLRLRIGDAFSRVCFVYLGLMVVALTFIFDIESIKSTAITLLTSLAPQEATRISQSFADLFPAIMTLSALISLTVNTLVTLRILEKTSPELYSFPQTDDFQIPSYWDIVFLVGLLLILTKYEMFAFIGKNVLLLSCVPLYLYGLSIIGSWLNQLENWWLWFVFAIVLSLVLVWPAMLIVLLGLLEPVLKIRKRFR